MNQSDKFLTEKNRSGTPFFVCHTNPKFQSVKIFKNPPCRNSLQDFVCCLNFSSKTSAQDFGFFSFFSETFLQEWAKHAGFLQ